MDSGCAGPVSAEELRTFVHALFSVSGLDDRDAAIMADSLVDADLRGTHSHGVIRLPFLVERLLKGGAKARPDIQVVNEAPSTALLDGDCALGAITATRAMDLAGSLAVAGSVGSSGLATETGTGGGGGIGTGG